MPGWIVRALMFLAGLITGIFIEQDALNFNIVQMVIAVLLFTLAVAVTVFWPSIQRWWRGRKQLNVSSYCNRASYLCLFCF